jgi:hypothetical protein
MEHGKKIICLILMLTLAGCTQAQILTDLDIAAAALAAVSTVPGIPPVYATYIADTAAALDCVSAAIEAGGTNAQVALAIGNCGLTAVAPDVPAGAPTTIVSAITAVVTAVKKVIADETQVQNALLSNPADNGNPAGMFGFQFGAYGKDKFTLGVGGKGHVKKIRAKLAAVKAKFPRVGK